MKESVICQPKISVGHILCSSSISYLKRQSLRFLEWLNLIIVAIFKYNINRIELIIYLIGNATLILYNQQIRCLIYFSFVLLAQSTMFVSCYVSYIKEPIELELTLRLSRKIVTQFKFTQFKSFATCSLEIDPSSFNIKEKPNRKIMFSVLNPVFCVSVPDQHNFSTQSFVNDDKFN